jgi:hypothetical protein
MDLQEAIQRALKNAVELEQPAWVCQEPEWHNRGRHFVYCSSYKNFDKNFNIGNCVAVVLPNGAIFRNVLA